MVFGHVWSPSPDQASLTGFLVIEHKSNINVFRSSMTEPFVVFGYGSLIFKVGSIRFTYAKTDG